MWWLSCGTAQIKMKGDITRKQERTAKKELSSILGTLGQVLKLFGGKYDAPLGESGMNTEEYMEYLGVPRFITPKGVKKGYTPALIKAAWADELKDTGASETVFYTYKTKYVRVIDSDPNDPQGRDKRVYASKEDALLGDAKKAMKVYTRVAIAFDKWNKDVLLNGLEQSKHIDKHVEKSTKSINAYETLEKVWIRYEVNGQVQVREIDRISTDY